MRPTAKAKKQSGAAKSGKIVDKLEFSRTSGFESKKITNPPQSASVCKNFEELKTYWAENYNVKVASELSELNFELVSAATVGIETIIKEFPPAGQYLKEFKISSEGVMSTVRGSGGINFDAECFSSLRKFKAALGEEGLHPKNMSVAEVGAHEMGHILEDWLIAKYGGGDKERKQRIFARRIVREAYQATENSAQPITKLRASISKYALKNLSECLAEAIADYVANGEKAAVLSRAIWYRLKEELK